MPSLAEYLDDILAPVSIDASSPRPPVARSLPASVSGGNARSTVPVDIASITKLLLVGCSAQLVFQLYEQLSRMQWCLREAVSGAEALEMLFSETFDLVLIAPQLPDLDALELKELIQKQSPGSQVISLDPVSRAAEGVFSESENGLSRL